MAPSFNFKIPKLLLRIKRETPVARTMVFTVGTLFEAALLLINAIAILNEERFLAKGRELSGRLVKV